MKKNYVRVKLNIVHHEKPICIWAIKKAGKKGLYSYMKVDKEGDYIFEDNTATHKILVYIVSPADIIWEKPARMNLKYSELEIVKEV